MIWPWWGFSVKNLECTILGSLKYPHSYYLPGFEQRRLIFQRKCLLCSTSFDFVSQEVYEIACGSHFVCARCNAVVIRNSVIVTPICLCCWNESFQQQFLIFYLTITVCSFSLIALKPQFTVSWYKFNSPGAGPLFLFYWAAFDLLFCINHSF